MNKKNCRSTPSGTKNPFFGKKTLSLRFYGTAALCIERSIIARRPRVTAVAGRLAIDAGAGRSMRTRISTVLYWAQHGQQSR